MQDITSNVLNTGCCIVGGGPAGLMLGLLLARAGVQVVVLEKHEDFLRDFRGDTIHPSTLELLYELGWLEEFLQRPHQEARQIRAVVGEETFVIADFAHIPTHCKFVALMPQWDFLNFLAEKALRYPTFRLLMQTEATELVEEAGRVVGIRAHSPTGPLEIRAPLTVGCDGRSSIVRRQAGLEVEDLGAPIDVLWLRIPRRPGDPQQPVGRFGTGSLFVMLDRGDYWQCAYVIRKGGIEALRAQGLPMFRERLVQAAPFIADRVEEIADWDQVKLLTVMVDRLKQWHRPGLLCIGDAAHAMSPVGGVGINLAIQDAVATANRLAEPLLSGPALEEDLAAIQQRRIFPTRWTQRLQLVVHHRLLEKVVSSDRPPRVPGLLRAALKMPLTRRIPAYLIGVGFRPEHIRTLERQPATDAL